MVLITCRLIMTQAPLVDRRVRGQLLQPVSLYTSSLSADCHGYVYTSR